MVLKTIRTSSYAAVVTAAVLFAAPAAAQEEGEKTTTWTLKSALKQMDKATKGLSGVAADVEWDQTAQSQRISGSGTVHMSFDGRMRAKVGGNAPRTILVLLPYVFVYRPDSNTVESYSTISSPDLLVPHVLTGFTPSGSGLKKEYNVRLIREEDLDDRKTLFFTLSPKSKELRAVISTVQLWVDQETWLPAQQLILHEKSRLRIRVRYLSVSGENDLPDTLFRPDWPEDAEKIKKR